MMQISWVQKKRVVVINHKLSQDKIMNTKRDGGMREKNEKKAAEE